MKKQITSILLSGFFLLWGAIAHAGITITYLHTDLSGSVIAKSDINGNVIWRKSYAAYGATTEKDEDNRKGFAGHEEDPDGLVYMGNRYYDPENGRFTSPDAMGFNASNPMSFNRYSYANDNPYKFVDPDGKEVTLNVERQIHTDKSIMSKLTVTSDKVSSTFEGRAMENVVAGNFGLKLPIPEGTYDASPTANNRVKLNDVHGYTDIEFHRAAIPEDLKGCFGVGVSSSDNRLNSTKDAMDAINKIIKDDGSNKIKVNVTGSNQVIDRRVKNDKDSQ